MKKNISILIVGLLAILIVLLLVGCATHRKKIQVDLLTCQNEIALLPVEVKVDCDIEGQIREVVNKELIKSGFIAMDTNAINLFLKDNNIISSNEIISGQKDLASKLNVRRLLFLSISGYSYSEPTVGTFLFHIEPKYTVDLEYKIYLYDAFYNRNIIEHTDRTYLSYTSAQLGCGWFTLDWSCEKAAKSWAVSKMSESIVKELINIDYKLSKENQ